MSVICSQGRVLSLKTWLTLLKVTPASVEPKDCGDGSQKACQEANAIIQVKT